MAEAGTDRLRRDVEIDARNEINRAIWRYRRLYGPRPRDLRTPKMVAEYFGRLLFARDRLHALHVLMVTDRDPRMS